MKSRVLTPIFLFFTISIGLYPLVYFLFDMSNGLMNSKSAQLLGNRLWQVGFYTHITFGGLALLSGCTQFLSSLRQKHLSLHRSLGKVYVASVMLSGVAGFGIAFAASAGVWAQMGFAALGFLWLYTTAKAFLAIKKRDIAEHQNWMTRSYALCFGAVTLRLWMPLFLGALGMSFSIAYPIIAWLSWVPNLVVAELIIRRAKPSLA
ncbi:DUF2306 domain-containing protein [Haliscomenobacter sp.]|uniref:DUF2306 domain-containing protein n=1 Tax=Haliscomenobacter sp. TaxID=2717303 RepID=UPI0035936E1C